MNRCTHHCFLLSALVGLAGCADRDPYLRTDVWQPTGANAANIAAMVVNPRDLIAGRNAPTQSARASEMAVEHIWTGQLQPLASSASGQGSGQSSATASATGGAGGTGGQ